jgi:hypothetical protein
MLMALMSTMILCQRYPLVQLLLKRSHGRQTNAEMFR